MTWTRDLPVTPGFYWIDHPEWRVPVVCAVVTPHDDGTELIVMLCGGTEQYDIDDFGILHPDVVWSGPIESPPRGVT